MKTTTANPRFAGSLCAGRAGSASSEIAGLPGTLCSRVTPSLWFGSCFTHLTAGHGDRPEVKAGEELTWRFRGELPRAGGSPGSRPAAAQGNGVSRCCQGHRARTQPSHTQNASKHLLAKQSLRNGLGQPGGSLLPLAAFPQAVPARDGCT